MNKWEAKLAEITAPGPENILGAIGFVVNNQGTILYRHTAGRQNLDPATLPLDPNSTIALHSAGKFVTHIAALQLVERGDLTLDEPICRYIPELDLLPLITPATEDKPIGIRPPANKISLRHLLLNTSGITEREAPLVREYFASEDARELTFDVDAPGLVKHFSVPLAFEPGEGFYYGWSIRFTQLLVDRLAGDFISHVQKHILDPLGMRSTTYLPRYRDDIWRRRLQMVERVHDKLIPRDDDTQGLTGSIDDIAVLFADLLSTKSKLLEPQNIELLFTGQLLSGTPAWRDLHKNPDNYDFVTSKKCRDSSYVPSLNWTFAGLLTEVELPYSKLPEGTVTWEGWPNVLWAWNKKRGIAAFFATQLVPGSDRTANEAALMFMEGVFKSFG